MTENRSMVIRVRVSPTEYDAITKAAGRSETAPSAWLRGAAMYCAELPQHPLAGDVFGRLQIEMMQREQKGFREYGKPLLVTDPRDGLQDALEEALDLSAYLTKLIMQRERTTE
jgi:hypothetical protein